MRARGWFSGLVLVLGLTAVAAAEPKPKPIDITPYRDKLVVLADAQGHIYVVTNGASDTKLFYGSKTVLHEQAIVGSSSNGDAWSLNVMAPRLDPPYLASVDRSQDGSYQQTCQGKDDRGLTQLTGDQAKAVLEKAKFFTSQRIRQSYLLARDDRGIYYYVDMIRKEYGGNGHRVFIGKKGAMKQIPLSDVASDSAGDVFTTKRGDLRLVRTHVGDQAKATVSWIKGQRPTSLIWLDLWANQRLIYRDLGIYKLSGMLCDNL